MNLCRVVLTKPYEPKWPPKPSHYIVPNTSWGWNRDSCFYGFGVGLRIQIPPSNSWNCFNGKDKFSVHVRKKVVLTPVVARRAHLSYDLNPRGTCRLTFLSTKTFVETNPLTFRDPTSHGSTKCDFGPSILKRLCFCWGGVVRLWAGKDYLRPFSVYRRLVGPEKDNQNWESVDLRSQDHLSCRVCSLRYHGSPIVRETHFKIIRCLLYTYTLPFFLLF